MNADKPITFSLSLAERFWAKVNKTDQCWEWTAAKNENGYGIFYDAEIGATVRAHRWAFEELVGEIHDGLEMDHLCRNRGCVRPDHLEPVTSQENTRRGNAGKHWAGKRIAPTISARTKGGGGLGTDFDLDGGLIASTGEISHCLNAGGMHRIDYETKTLVFEPHHDEHNGRGVNFRETDTLPTIRGPHGCDNPLIAHSLRGEGFDASEDGTGRGIPLVPIPILEAGARTGKSTDDIRAGIGIGQPGDPMFTLQSGKQHAIAFNLRGREDGAQAEVSDVASLRAASGGSSRSYVAQEVAHSLGTRTAKGTDERGDGSSNLQPTASGVRRLLPVECEALQGLPRNWTLVHHRGKLAADGNRYKAIGNGMAVPVMREIGDCLRQCVELVDGKAQEVAA